MNMLDRLVKQQTGNITIILLTMPLEKGYIVYVCVYVCVWLNGRSCEDVNVPLVDLLTSVPHT